MNPYLAEVVRKIIIGVLILIGVAVLGWLALLFYLIP